MADDELLDRVFSLVSSGDCPSALPLLDQAITANARDWNAQYLRAHCLRRSGQLDQALADIDRARLDAPSGDARRVVDQERGIILQSLGRLDEAIAAFEEILRDDPDATLAWNSAGYTAKLAEDWPQALHYYEGVYNALYRAVAQSISSDRSRWESWKAPSWIDELIASLDDQSVLGESFARVAMLVGAYGDYDAIAFPTAESVDDITSSHPGALWFEQPNAETGGTSIVFTHAFTQAVVFSLVTDPGYAPLSFNVGQALQETGQDAEADRYFQESERAEAFAAQYLPSTR